ncbi:hypothetical protein Sjap_008707 [Stephania japonica]|uniref:Uncharacterized protein n=1 Tax=Stephania japonica TaxID=461633 RepID=A0AAP0PB47_9MAGN
MAFHLLTSISFYAYAFYQVVASNRAQWKSLIHVAEPQVVESTGNEICKIWMQLVSR